MSEDVEIFNINVSIKSRGESLLSLVGKYEDSELGVSDSVEFAVDLPTFDEFGGEYIDNLVESLLDEVKESIIKVKKTARAEIRNIYDEATDG